MTVKVDIADLSIIFLTYDEPERDQFWVKIQNLVPWARRVDGVKGSDAAHKAAAAVSDTERFILIDGDNLPDPAFFRQRLILDDNNRDCVFRWRARNVINGLAYGNGGISCWTRDYVNRMRTHEASDGRAETQVEFCFDSKYLAMHDIYSTTYINQSPFQAWRAGFREGVKLSLDRGSRVGVSDFRRRINGRILDYLSIWMSVGADEHNGLWAMLGARAGCYRTMLTEWDHREVQDFDALSRIWEQYSTVDIYDDMHDLGTVISHRLGLNIITLASNESKFFKYHQAAAHRNLDINLSEHDYIRLGISQDD